jgi:hypothetical protein
VDGLIQIPRRGQDDCMSEKLQRITAASKDAARGRAGRARGRADAARARGDNHTATFHEAAAAAHDLAARAADELFEADVRVEGRRTT